MIAGKFDIFKGPLKDNKGNTSSQRARSSSRPTWSWRSMNYLVEGVVGI
jgi:basic membrane protein A